MTVREFLTGTLRMLGVVASGETPAASDLNDSLESLNSLLEFWSTEGLLIPSEFIEEFTLIPDQQKVTIGPSGDFVTTRPMIIEKAKLKYQGTGEASESNIDILQTVERWADISVKTTQSTIPTKMFVNWTMPNAELLLWPVPSEALKIVLYGKKPLASFATLDDEMTLPPGYSLALKFNLADTIASEFGTELSPKDAQKARDLYAGIARVNTRPVEMKSDVFGLTTGRGKFNILTGE